MVRLSQIAIVVPVLARPQNAAPLIASIKATTSVPHRILFVCSPGDEAEIAACREIGADVMVTDWQPGPADFARKTNLGYRSTDEPWIFCGADDLAFEPGWDLAALAVAEQAGAGVIGTNDLQNPAVKRGLASTHSLVRRSYVERYGGSYDGSGEVYSERYDHQWVDGELVETAKRRRQWAFARDAVVRHLHPTWGLAPMDATYEKALRASRSDHALFRQRMRQLGRRALQPAPLMIEPKEGDPTIAICIATYGGEEWRQLAFDRAGASAARQGANEVILEHQAQGSVASARNAAAERARSDWLCFLDADDELEAGFVDAMRLALREHPARPVEHALYTPAISYLERGIRRPPRFWPVVDLKVANWLVIGTLVERELFLALGGFDGDPAFGAYEDWELWVRADKAGARVVKVPDAVYIAHADPDSRHRGATHAERLRWHYEIGRRHYPELYDEGWLARNGRPLPRARRGRVATR